MANENLTIYISNDFVNFIKKTRTTSTKDRIWNGKDWIKKENKLQEKSNGK